MTEREEKVGNIIKRLASEFLSRESNRTSLITVTDVRMQDKERNAIILFTVLPEAQAAIALAFAKRKRSDFREYIKDHTRIKTVPRVDFEIDKGEKFRQRIDELLRGN
ncbi:MAG: ribosome-binding factor A [Parcubacteria group bacterium]|nr:ribosome-binding factor A [Parcubacteria group bacterium]